MDIENQLEREISLSISVEKKLERGVSFSPPLFYKKPHFYSILLGGVVVILSIPFLGGLGGIGLGIGAITNLFTIAKWIL